MYVSMYIRHVDNVPPTSPFKVSGFKVVRFQFPNSCSINILEVKEFSFPNREKTHVEIN